MSEGEVWLEGSYGITAAATHPGESLGRHVDGLPVNRGYGAILVIVDRLSKSAHFISLRHPFTGNKLKGSSSYHPQTDGQTKVVSKTLEYYLRCYCHEEQTMWKEFIFGAEYWAYFTNIKIGNPPKSFELNVDTGSALTWVQCDGPCLSCTLPPDRLYTPPEGSVVPCGDPICALLQGDEPNCEEPTDRCDYVIRYGDRSSTHGYLVKDQFPLQLVDGSVIESPLVFGCGYNQTGVFKGAGILGLNRGRVGFLSQMHLQGVIQPVVGHCLSTGKRGGFLFLGDDLVPPSGISWTPITNTLSETYSSGPVNLLFDKSTTQVTDLQFNFDSGSTFSFLNKTTYKTTLSQMKGRVCLGIADGSIIGLENTNVIGAVSMQDKLVIYDNVNHRIGWTSWNCSVRPTD
ncbi:aspartyl protease APCB1-like [Tripterygium wilfordii]|uniref:aspartyl protease APCB1-like n=1 Tax=Tripterygium wilfordii TaxID=458696 RepID=UPI0018F7F62D|nr:aspartyl protease APCB1-like [Tripterygium wilfordii]